MTELNCAERLYMSGTRATFTLKPGITLSKATVAETLKKKGLQLEEFRQERRPPPAAIHVAEVEGLG
ncbi:MAG: hypothetical protein ACKVX7_04250 [Planctomycetota bacterium]